MSNYRSGYLEQGAPVGAVRKDVLLSADNQIIDLDDVSAVYLQSDNTTATNRTFTLKSGQIFGHLVTFFFVSGSSYTCDLQSSGNVKLSGAWQPLQYDSLQLQWDGTYWTEIGRGNTGSGGVKEIADGVIVNADINASAAIAFSKLAALDDGKILIGNASNVAVKNAVTGDVTISNSGVTAIASGVIVNADVSGSAAIDFSKLAALSSANILVGNVSNVPVSVAVTGDVTISNAGVTAIASDVIINADVKSDAAIAFSKLAALTSTNILVGSAGNVATSVAMSGDITIGNTGVTAIGAGKVTEAMLVSAGTAGLQARRVAYAKFDPSATAGQRTQAAHDLGVTIPDNAFVVGAWYWVETTFTSAGDTATIALSLEGANDIVSAVAINDGGNPWDTTSKPVEGVTKLETTSTWLATTAARAVTATVATEDLTAGKMHIWLEYQLFS
jgi:hypothetical protein